MDAVSLVRTRPFFKNILYATDFSAAAEFAAQYARTFANSYGSTVHAVHVRPSLAYGMVTPESWPAMVETEQALIQEDRERLDHTFSETNHTVTIGTGGVWDVLSDLIEEKSVDLIVLGTRGREGLEKIVLGSVAEEVLRRASCPVLTVGPDVVVSPERVVKMKRVLFSTDFSPVSQTALPYAVSLAKENDAFLYMLHALDRSRARERATDQDLQADVIQRMRGLLSQDDDLWCVPRFLVEEGEPAEVALRVANREDVDLIVLGVNELRSEFSLTTHLPWPIAHKIIASAPCPVLTVRA